MSPLVPGGGYLADSLQVDSTYRKVHVPPPRRLTDFEQILIGLTVISPRSGYDLKRYFASTPAAVYEPSSGALYPALRRLEQRGLLRSELAVSVGKREQRRYAPTASGRDAHLRWLREPVDKATVGRDLGIHLMRFGMAEQQLRPEEVLAFLRDLCDALESFITAMETYLRDTPLLGRHPALAIEHGLAVHQASLAWARSAIEQLRLSALSTTAEH